MRARSTLHPIVRRAAVSGFIDATVVDGVIDTGRPVRGRLELVLTDFRADDIYDSEIERRLDVQRHPVVVAELLEATAQDGNGHYRMAGELSLHGRTQRLDGDALVRCDAAMLSLEGSLTLDVRSFGLQPPKFLLLRVQPQVQVTLHLRADADTDG